MTGFCLLNTCSDPDLNAELLQQIALALMIQLDRDVAPWWGGGGGNHRVRAATADNPPADGEVVALILDTLPDNPGAVAFHSWEGQPKIYAARDMCPSLTVGAFSLSQAISHELIEEVGDEGCNLWADDGAGASWALELCDAVEAGAYTINGIAMSDLVLPPFFNPGAVASRYSLLSAPNAPFLTAPGGYQVMRPTGGGEVQVFGDIHPDRLAHKQHWSSRTTRRRAKL